MFRKARFAHPTKEDLAEIRDQREEISARVARLRSLLDKPAYSDMKFLLVRASQLDAPVLPHALSAAWLDPTQSIHELVQTTALYAGISDLLARRRTNNFGQEQRGPERFAVSRAERDSLPGIAESLFAAEILLRVKRLELSFELGEKKQISPEDQRLFEFFIGPDFERLCDFAHDLVQNHPKIANVVLGKGSETIGQILARDRE